MANFDLKNPMVQKTVLSVLLSVGLLAVFFLTHFLPFGYPNQQDRLNVLKTDYERKSTELARARTRLASAAERVVGATAADRVQPAAAICSS